MLEWQCLHGKEIEDDWVAKAAEKRGISYPSFLSNKPELKHYLMFFWVAFWDLSTCRAYGMGEGPIPWDKAREYAECYDYADTDALWRTIAAMDAKYLGLRNKGGDKNG